MKKVFLIVAVFSFGYSYGQQDILDIQKYLENKNLEEKNALIKPFPKLFEQGNITTDRLLLTLTNGDKVYSLPQDNMPCVVTDLNQFNMPNGYVRTGELSSLLATGNRPGKMPNVSQQPPLIGVK